MEIVSFSSILFGREGPKLLKNKISTHPTTPGAPPRLHLAWSDGVSSATQIDRVPTQATFGGSFWVGWVA